MKKKKKKKSRNRNRITLPPKNTIKILERKKEEGSRAKSLTSETVSNCTQLQRGQKKRDGGKATRRD